MPHLPAWLAGRGRSPLRAPDAKAERPPFAVSLAGLGPARWSARDPATLAREGYAKNAVVYRCVRMVAEAAASIPLAVFDRGARAADHPLQRLLDRPSPDASGVDLLEGWLAGLQIAGSAYLQAQGSDDGPPTELYPLRADRVAPVVGADGWPAAWSYDTGAGRPITLPRQEVLQLTLYNPLDDLAGQSPLTACAAAVDVHNAGSAWNKALLDNSARPSGALVYGGAERLTPEQFAHLKAELGEAHAGAAAAGRPLLLDGGLEWKPMALTPAEMDFAELKHSAAREIALAFGVPPQLLGIPGDATYSNYKEATSAFWRATVAPLAGKAARALEGWLAPRFETAAGALAIRPDLDAVPAFADDRAALWARLDAASFLTPDEKRRMAGLGDAP
ncbi:MAG: phage portal protein [Caulobacteraceae bacterium]|nr:phage portal protein [Caulobacter sp.]